MTTHLELVWATKECKLLMKNTISNRRVPINGYLFWTPLPNYKGLVMYAYQCLLNWYKIYLCSYSQEKYMISSVKFLCQVNKKCTLIKATANGFYTTRVTLKSAETWVFRSESWLTAVQHIVVLYVVLQLSRLQYLIQSVKKWNGTIIRYMSGVSSFV